MKRLPALIVGISLGAASWGLSQAVSGRFEPFDSGVGFLVTQIILSSAAFMVGIRRGIVDPVVLVSGAYLGMNAYAYAFGGSESKAWATLGAITTIALVVFPALAGVLGGIARRVLARSRQGEAKRD
jgi:hypothetical protein